MTITDLLRPTAVRSKYVRRGGHIRQLDPQEVPPDDVDLRGEPGNLTTSTNDPRRTTTVTSTQTENLCSRWTTLTPDQRAHAEANPIWIRPVGFTDVAPATDEVGEETGHAVAAALGLPLSMLKIAWLQPCESDHPDAVGPIGAGVAGLASQRDVGLILVRADLSLPMTRRTIAHELRHVWQRLRDQRATEGEELMARTVARDVETGVSGDTPDPIASAADLDEIDARRFAAEWMEGIA